MSLPGTDFSFFWHDYETFGVVPRRDRPAQFAGVRTDAELNEIGEPVMLHCQPAGDSLPDPESCLLTGITPQHCLEHGVPEHAFARAIEEQLAKPGTVGVGYNSIRFDDEVTRFLFWRNLIDPYAREWQNGCGRWDLLDVVRATRALRPEGITWPTHDDGRASFKLEHLTAANGLAHEAAHDALSDVRATIALARLIRAQQPRLWEFCLKLRRKDAVIAEIGSGRPFLHVSGMYPPERGCLAIVWPLAPHPTNKNELIVWDLSIDPGGLSSLDAVTIRERMFTRADELPEGVTRLPIKTIHINKSPVVVGNLKALSPEMATRWGIDVAQALRHAEAAAQQGAAIAGLWPEVFARPAPAQVPDVDEDLYGGFVGHTDRGRLQRLRRSSRRSNSRPRLAFDDARLEEIVFRYRARNFATTLTSDEVARWEEHRVRRLHEGEGGALTLQVFFDRIDALNESSDERGQAILESLYDYAEQIAPEPA
ncbi:MAG: exodeoxyribonuclease I [Piscinibacter sp.]|nr:exodeoxyribonuclease I [Piscinibacter sp.]